MIQRIQTLYLAVALGLMVSVFFSIYATYIPFTVLTGAVSVLLCAIIVLFKVRKIQIRLCIYTSVVLLAQQIWMGAVYFKNRADVSFSVTTIFPIIAIIMVLLALRAIASDEALVQSYNRLRPKSKKK
ncbi:MAG TPA: DUF4293 family protein [Bacteroidales bacterium]|nr:DUF4293 family protein [Bacteroidales bacterium]